MTRKSATRFFEKVMPKEIYMTRTRGAATAQSATRFSEQTMPKIEEA
jgi:hypothetical protein